MNAMNRKAVARLCRVFTAGLPLLALSACNVLRPATTPPAALYSLDSTQNAMTVPAAVPAPEQAPTLIVMAPHAAAGFDSSRIIYVREPHKLDYFAHSQWVDTPAHMIGPRLVAALVGTGAFHAVVLTPGAATGDMRLDTEIIRLQHEFISHPSRVHVTLRATLVDDRTRRVLAWREFDGHETALNEDPYGGVVAANLAVQALLEKLAAFCAETARSANLARRPQ